jgi:hypothetical protein
MVTLVKMTAWGRLHGSLALVLDDANYATVTRQAVELTNRLFNHRGQPSHQRQHSPKQTPLPLGGNKGSTEGI